MTETTAPAERRSLWALATGARPVERRALLVAFLYFFCVLGSYYLLRPVRDQFSAAVGSTNLWQFWGSTFIVTLALAPVFGALVARFRREVFVPVVYLFFIACLLVFVVAFAAQDAIGVRLLGTVFYVWLSVFNLFVVSVFWSFMADIFDSGQARRLFPVIAMGGTLGAIAGPIMAGILPIQTLLLTAIVLLLIAMACARWMSTWSHRHPNPERNDELGQGEVIGGDIWAGLKQMFRSPFLRKMAALILLGDAVGTVAYALAADLIGAHYVGAEARKTVYASIDLITNLLQLGLQLSITRILMTRFGAGVTLVAGAAISVVVLVVTAITGQPAVIVMLVATRGSAYGIGKPASDSLYARAQRETRYKGKNAIDTVAWRFGDVVSSLTMKALAPLGLGVAGFALLSTLAAALSGWFGWRAAKSSDLRMEPADRKASAVRDRNFLQSMRRTSLFALALLAALVVWGFVWEPSQLVRRDYTLSLPSWPQSCNGLRVAVVADLHAGSPHIDLDKVDSVVDMVDRSDADIVLLAGDYVIQAVLGGHYIPISAVAPHLHAMTTHKPVYAVLGNHDWWRGGVASSKALRAAGIVVLEDQAVEVRHGACHFWLAGIGDYVTTPHNVGKALAGIPPDGAILALTHEPRLFPKIPARVALLVAGHTHGGQIHLPLGWLSGPRRSTQWNVRGHIVEGGRHLFVSPGIGTSHMGVRIGTPPEVSMLTLNAQGP